MRKTLLPLVFTVLVASLWGQQPSDDARAAIKADFENRILKTKLALPDPSTHFDEAGQPMKKPRDCVSWTLCNVFSLEQLTIEDHSLKIKAQRIAVGFADRKEKYYRVKDKYASIEIDFTGDVSHNNLQDTLCRIFVCDNAKFSDGLPFFWARFFDPNAKPPADDEPPKESTAKSSEPKGPVVASKLLKQPPPSYPETAKAYARSGTVTLEGIIGIDGKLHNVYVYSPAGFGFDEAAVEAVKKWLYQPVSIAGKAIAVDTTININFNLDRR
jgi:TonB family protein